MKLITIRNGLIVFCALFFAQDFLVSAYAESYILPNILFQDSTKSKKQNSKNPNLLDTKSNNISKKLPDSLSTKDKITTSNLLSKQDSIAVKKQSDTLKGTPEVKKVRKPFLDDIVVGKGKDSMVYDVQSGKLWIYKEGDITYSNKQMTADYFEMQLDSSKIIAKGMPDSAGILTKAKFIEGQTTYDLDSIVYNVKSEKAKIYGIAFKEGEGILRGDNIKKMNDGVFNISGGKYSTCDAEHPHFYLALTKAQYVDTESSKKVIVGPSYLVLEDVPLPLAIPFGFFPMMKDKNSGVILPDIGEENQKGFYVRGLGYYFVFGEYMDLAARAGIYTMGSWEASLTSSYKVRYKFNGNFNVNYSKDVFGTKGSKDYKSMNNYRVMWTHSQDPKFLPGTTFSANVNWSSSNYNKYDAVNINDYVSSQTNSSVSFSKTWAGKPFSFSANLQHSQNNKDSTVMLSMPNMVFGVSRFMPFQRKNAVGKQRWYEKISLGYTGTFNNTVRTKQDLLFKPEMFKNMKYGMKHDIPISTSLNILKYFNVSPSASYTERWYFDRINKEWDPALNQVITRDTTNGFYRVYDYRFSAGMTTKMYGSFMFKGKDPVIKAIRHVLTPSISGSFTPDFGDPKYGFYKAIQSDAQGNTSYYSPYENGIYSVPGRGKSAALSFSLGNTVEMKVRSKADSTGMKKLKLIESLQISSSYNFLADSLNLAPFSVNLRTTLFKSLGLNVSSTFDPYGLDEKGRKINKFALSQGQLARLTSLGFSFGYSFRSVFGAEDSGTGSGSIPKASQTQQTLFDERGVDYAEQQRILSQSYYDFSVPWNLSFNYNFSYSKPGHVSSLTQTLSFTGSLNLTPKFGFTFNGGYDFQTKQLTPGSISMTRDLHCWQMGFTWVPIGFRKSWNFTIRVKSGMLADLKYEKSSGYTNNMSNYY